MEAKTFQDPPPLPEGGNAAHRAEWIRLEESLEYMECRNCHGEITVTSNDTIHEYKWPGVRCGCGRDKADPVRRERYVAKREREMQMAREQRLVERGEAGDIIKYESINGPVSLTIEGIKTFVNPDVTDGEARLFMEVCAAHRVHPYADGEIHCIKHGNSAMYWVIGKQAYVNRGTKHLEYKSHKDGVITVDSSGGVHYRRGQYVPRGEELDGSWCEIERQTQGTIYESYGLAKWAKRHKYDDRNGKWKAGDFMALWAENTPMMMLSTAVKQTFRMAFPDVFSSSPDQQDEGIIVVSPVPIDEETKVQLDVRDSHAGDDLFPQKCEACGAEAKTDNAGVLSCANCGVIYDPNAPEDPPPSEFDSQSGPPEQPAPAAFDPPDGGVKTSDESSNGGSSEPTTDEPGQVATPANPKVGIPSKFWSAVSKIDFDGKGNAPSNLDVSKALGADPIVYMRGKDYGPENWDILLDEVVELLKKSE